MVSVGVASDATPGPLGLRLSTTTCDGDIYGGSVISTMRPASVSAKKWVIATASQAPYAVGAERGDPYLPTAYDIPIRRHDA